MGNIAKREIICSNIRFYTIDLRGGAIRLCPTPDQRDHLRLPGAETGVERARERDIYRKFKKIQDSLHIFRI